MQTADFAFDAQLNDQITIDSTLTFVPAADYEFVGGGNAANGY